MQLTCKVQIYWSWPVELGYAQELWTLAKLHKHIQKHAEEAGFPRLSTVTKTYIQKFAYRRSNSISK